MQYRQLHPWNVSVKEAAEIQRRLRDQVSLVDGFDPQKVELVAGVDVSIPRFANIGRAAVVILSFPQLELVEVQRAERDLEFPYIPGFLSFRETPIVLAAFDKIKNVPDVIIVDGQGIAHPRRLGIAAHLGLLLDLPTIGCAKSHLYGTFDEPGPTRGSTSPLLAPGGDQIGAVVRTKDNTKPVFISPGHKVSIETSVRMILECTTRYRLPEPIRAAHNAAGGKFEIRSSKLETMGK